eukprot:gene7972-8831_t
MDITNENIDFQDICNNNSGFNNKTGIKRRRSAFDDVLHTTTRNLYHHPALNENCNGKVHSSKKSRTFLHFQTNTGVYQTDNLKHSKDGDTLYLPLNGDVFVNINNADEITFDEGVFFVADSAGRYSNSIEGKAMNIWRFSDSKQQMIVSKSLLITQSNVFDKIRDHLLES